MLIKKKRLKNTSVKKTEIMLNLKKLKKKYEYILFHIILINYYN